ncbi:MAG: hypothetical protein E7A63_08895 [Clostridium butyricum]|nr:hypothetical protein [Clostridium butyricum]
MKIYELPQNIITTRSDNSSTQISLNYCIKILRETEESSNSILAQMQKNVAKMAALNKFLRIYYTRVKDLYKNL